MSPPIETGNTDADERAELIFVQALETNPREREAYLTEACGADTGLRAEVDGLLEDHGEAGTFLNAETPALRELEPEFARPETETAGGRIGPYKLLEQIGEGGFGTVWVAEQEKPVRRRVALKIIKPGMDSREVIARFEQERQALAMMEHPNIARVLDAGATPLGRPFFVMELVRGIKITDYCDQAQLSTEERLKLFVHVCNAVQHAHQKGIIHRDLKPSNILVTLHDGVPVPKVIDFGVAKATQQQRLTDLTVYTQFEQMVGTPLYMSPEQAEMSGLDIDTRSDIYSLGVLLYELLVGRTPFDPETLMKRGLDEIRRVVREQEPQKPSTFVSTMALALRTNVAQRRQTDSTKLIGQIRGDLDWIVMKALEKDRARRYETASGFAQDIQRHLASEPVHARPPTQLYRFRRFAKRNRVAFTAGTAVFAALFIGLGVSMWMFVQEREARHGEKQARQQAVAAEMAQREERNKAETEASRSRQVAQFLRDMLNGVGPSVALGRDTTMLQEILDKTAERLGKDLKDQPAVEAELRNTIGEVYGALGDYEKAGVMHREAVAIGRRLIGNDHPTVATFLHNLAVTLHGQGKLAEAEIRHRESLAMRKNHFGIEHLAVAQSLGQLATVLCSQQKLAEAETMHRESLAIFRRLLGNEHRDVATSLNHLASVLDGQLKLAEAEMMHRESLAMLRKLVGNEHPNVAAGLYNLASVLSRQRKWAEAEAMYRESLAMLRKLVGNEHPDVAKILHGLGHALEEQDKFAEAETMYREALTLNSERAGHEHVRVAECLATLLQKQNKLVEAETMAREALARSRKLLGNEHPDVASGLNSLGLVLEKQDKLAEAETMYREALAMRRKLLGDDDPSIADSLISLATVLEKEHKLAESEACRREGLAIRRRLWGEHPRVAAGLHILAGVIEKQNKLAEAETIYREALAMGRKLFGNEDQAVLNSVVQLCAVLGRQGRHDEAAELLRNEIEAIRKTKVTSPAAFEGVLAQYAEILYRGGHYAEAEPFYRELIESRRDRLGAEHDTVLTATAGLARLLSDWEWSERGSKPKISNQSPGERDSPPEAARRGSAAAESKSEIAQRAREAERLLRECLAIRLLRPKTAPWRSAEERSRLGGALVSAAVTDPALSDDERLRKFSEAEALLLEGNGVLQQGEKVDSKYKRDSFTRLVRLYEAWDNPDKANEWRGKLAGFEKVEAKAGTKAVTSKP